MGHRSSACIGVQLFAMFCHLLLLACCLICMLASNLCAQCLQVHSFSWSVSGWWVLIPSPFDSLQDAQHARAGLLARSPCAPAWRASLTPCISARVYSAF